MRRQFFALTPLSAFLDLLRLGGPKDLHGRGWLIFFQLLGVAAKVCYVWFAAWQSWPCTVLCWGGGGRRPCWAAAVHAQCPPTGTTSVAAGGQCPVCVVVAQVSGRDGHNL